MYVVCSTSMRIIDGTGYIDVRSWSHSEAEFHRFKDGPVILKRARLTSLDGVRMIELHSFSMIAQRLIIE